LRQPTPQQANFICNIPRAALANAAASAIPGRASIYGHGLFGSADEVSAGNVESMGNEHNFVFCATDWIGMSETDVPTRRRFLWISRTSRRSSTPRAVRAQRAVPRAPDDPPAGFVSIAAFQDSRGNPVIDTANVFYDGNSQGGIMAASSCRWRRTSRAACSACPA
jgi:hypothetical protein